MQLLLHKGLVNKVQSCKIVPYALHSENYENYADLKKLRDKRCIRWTNIKFGIESVTLSTYLTVTISMLTLIILLFMFASNEWLSMTRLLSILMFNP